MTLFNASSFHLIPFRKSKLKKKNDTGKHFENRIVSTPLTEKQAFVFESGESSSAETNAILFHKPPEKQFNVLIVDDAHVNRYLLKQYISKSSLSSRIHVDESSNGWDAIEKHKNKHYHVTFMDIKMPGIDGLETSKRLFQNRNDTVIMATTGQIETTMAEQCKNLGIYTIFGKPFAKDVIISTMETVLLNI